MLKQVITLVALAVATSACGGPPGAEAVDGNTITIVGLDTLAFEPAEIEVEAGEYTIVFDNSEAGLVHALAVAPDGTSRDIGDTGEVFGGETESIEVELEAGRYDYLCRVDNHHLAGMTGILIVT